MRKLRQLRIEKQMTQGEIAKFLGIKESTYSHYENGINKPSIDKLLKLADFYHTTIDSLLEHEVPYVIDKGLLSSEQANLVDKVKELTKEQCILVDGFIEGIKKSK